MLSALTAYLEALVVGGPAGVPFGRSYWVVPGRLLAGAYPGDPDRAEHRRKLRGLREAGVRCILSLIEPGEVGHGGAPFEPYADDFRRLVAETGQTGRCLRYPVRDVTAPTADEMVGILDTIDLALEAGCPVYLHCWGGRGRTGTVVGCWLARHDLAVGERALARIRELRVHDLTAHKPSPETHAQRQLVVHWPVGR